MSSAKAPSHETLLTHEPFVRAVVRRLLADEAQVQDVVQETWITALRRSPRSVGRARAWLSSVARRKALSLMRSIARREARERTGARSGLAEPADETHARLEAHRAVVEAVLALHEPYRTVVLLRYYDDISATEIARRTGRDPATVRSQLHRAHGLLREQLDAGQGRPAWAMLAIPALQRGSTASWAAAAGVVAAVGICAFTVRSLAPSSRPIGVRTAARPSRSGPGPAATTLSGGSPASGSERVPVARLEGVPDQSVQSATDTSIMPAVPSNAASSSARVLSARDEARELESILATARSFLTECQYDIHVASASLKSESTELADLQDPHARALTDAVDRFPTSNADVWSTLEGLSEGLLVADSVPEGWSRSDTFHRVRWSPHFTVQESLDAEGQRVLVHGRWEGCDILYNPRSNQVDVYSHPRPIAMWTVPQMFAPLPMTEEAMEEFRLFAWKWSPHPGADDSLGRIGAGVVPGGAWWILEYSADGNYLPSCVAAREDANDAMLVAYRFEHSESAGRRWLDSLVKLQIGPRQINFQRWTVSDVKPGLDEGADRILVVETSTSLFDRRGLEPGARPVRVTPYGPTCEDWPQDLRHRFRFDGGR